ncbi:hypothetical protein GCM10017044_20820 [Kordiimonas sediminis]|uniref:N-acetyltransferase domain-containing protein n=2 Tax=Kordiimonas sediminis TaxID=1735581 RepID=A0A919AUF8_9PROT|nr:hypothetical protein GCM10017044_20820 [Kordiimonas sediminis]
MSVADGARNQGIGSRLLGTFSDWVANHATLEKIELHVHADNAQAIALYEKHGFTVEGKRIGAIRYEDGRVIDDILMAKWPLLQPVSNQATL